MEEFRVIFDGEVQSKWSLKMSKMAMSDVYGEVLIGLRLRSSPTGVCQQLGPDATLFLCRRSDRTCEYIQMTSNYRQVIAIIICVSFSTLVLMEHYQHWGPLLRLLWVAGS